MPIFMSSSPVQIAWLRSHYVQGIVASCASSRKSILTYLVRTLLSENQPRYETVESTPQGLVPRLIERDGPTGLFVTTTAASLHPENETRMLSIVLRDDSQQTRAVFDALAATANHCEAATSEDLEPWIALQRWLELAGCREVVIPYAHELAGFANPRAVRLRRDFGAVLSLIKANAILHQTHRERTPDGKIVASLDDYAVVYRLIIDLVSESAEATVSQSVRETVEAVRELSQDGKRPVKVVEVARHLKIDKSSASRRVRVAKERGYLTNEEDRRGRPSRLVPRELMPEEAPVLPSPEKHGCQGGGYPPPDNRATAQLTVRLPRRWRRIRTKKKSYSRRS